jgi:hypothetical protein
VRYYADILGAILPCISDKEEKIRVVARETNEELRSIHVEPSDGFDVGAILSVARRLVFLYCCFYIRLNIIKSRLFICEFLH